MCGAKGFFIRLEQLFNRLRTGHKKTNSHKREKAQVIGNAGGIDYLGTLAMKSDGNFGALLFARTAKARNL
jgi:hypothetical protein